MSDTEHAAHLDHRLHHWLLGTSAVVAAFSLAPYILPVFGIGDAETASNAMHVLGAPIDKPFGSGFAATLQGGIASIPLIGGALTSVAPVSLFGLTLTSGTLASFAFSGVVGIGGALFADWLAKREDPNAKIHWSKWIRIAAITTSALVVLPGMLSAISIAITFFASLNGATTDTILAMRDSIGATNAHAGAMGGLSSVLSCLLSCAASFLPVGLAGAFSTSKPNTSTAPQTQKMTGPAPMVELASPIATSTGQSCRLAFRLRDTATGRVLTVNDIATTHTEKLHTMVVDRTLGDYHHLHPQFDPASGLFMAEFTPRSAQPYSAWHDYTLVNGAQVIAHTPLPAAARTPAMHPVIQLSPQAEAAGIVINTAGNAPLAADRGGMLHIALHDKAGQPVSGLEPIMGAMAHLVGFSADGQHFMHCHPVASTADGVDFHVQPTQAGPTKFFLQLKREGQEIVIPFGLRVEPAKQFTTREAMRPAHSHMSAQIA